jgi:hypothetical protein
VQLADGNSWLIPYSRIAFVKSECGTDHNTLRLLSDTHEIRVVGRNLRQLERALQKFGVGWMKAAPSRYEPEAGDNLVWITDITVNELEG